MANYSRKRRAVKNFPISKSDSERDQWAHSLTYWLRHHDFCRKIAWALQMGPQQQAPLTQLEEKVKKDQLREESRATEKKNSIVCEASTCCHVIFCYITFHPYPTPRAPILFQL
uniref:Uncharacterized protein n=1 Tax=Timema poppense TaxID=170557 RepID=A0A7R9CMB4_TIMPO|nr:unnamed protein product [Timema poppensis]